MTTDQRIPYILTYLLLATTSTIYAAEPPLPDEGQLPKAMHSKMAQLPEISVAPTNADIIGHDNRALQAAVDYIAALGGGTVTIGSGQFTMHDSLHLRTAVTVRGQNEKTILKKAPSTTSKLTLDGDFGQQQFTVEDPAGFKVGYGVTISDDNAGGFHTTVARITGQNGNTFSIDKPLMADCMVHNNAKAVTTFPVISAYDTENIIIENLTIDGNKAVNAPLNGCRGAGIFLYRSFAALIKNCTVTGYNGDGISFQQSNDVTVTDCISQDNASLGLHPGSGSQRPIIRNCTSRRNGTDGLFLCWRVRHGLFENNLLLANGRFGISIGHKDSDNLLRSNTIRLNNNDGVFFRNESLAMAAHRNRLEDNVIENNGTAGQYAGIRIRGHTNDLIFKNNIIRDTRPPAARTQTVGIKIEEDVGEITLDQNRIEAQTPVQDNRLKTSNRTE